MGKSIGKAIVTDGLVLALDAANKKSYPGTGTTWSDLSSNGNNGTLVNGPNFNNSNGGIFNFDGTDDYVSFQTITNNIYTLDFWYKMGGNDGTYGYFASGGANGVAISEGGTGNGLVYGRFYYWNGSSASVLSDIPSTTIWNNICVIINTTTNNLQLFGNGSQQYNSTVSGMATSVSNIGRYVVANNNFLKGNLATYKIYNKQLTPAEVLQNYNATKDRFGL